MLSRSSGPLVLGLAALVLGGTGWGYVDWRERVHRDVTAADPATSALPTGPSATSAPSASPSSTPVGEEAVASLWIGDGYTSRYACSAARRVGWSCQVQAEEGAGFVNGGPGSRLLDRLPDAEAAVRAAGVDPGVVVVDAGRNDVRLVDGPNLRTAMDDYLDALDRAFPDATVVLVVPWTLAQEGPLPGDVAAVVGELAEEHEALVVDPVAEGWAGAGETDLPELRDPAGGASAAGDEHVATRLARALRRLDLPLASS